MKNILPNDESHQAFIKDIADILPKKQIYTDSLSRFAYGTDASFYRYIPQVVVRAHNESEIIHLLRLAKIHKVALTFRASGTSLSGQTCSESVLVLVGDEFLTAKILDQGHKIKLGAMIIGADANRQLKPYGRKIGPDPASINTARVGGMLANNSSGMCCGTKDNSYNTLSSLRMILADGALLDTSDVQNIADFRLSHKDFLQKLSALSNQIKNNPELCARVRHKYRMKNTTGYGVNALIDFDDPIDILTHLMVGSEGTLGFISEVIYKTVHDYPNKASAFVFFTSLDQCCRAVTALRHHATVDAVELFDAGTIRALAEGRTGLPDFFHSDFSADAACLLIESKAENNEILDKQIAHINTLLKDFDYKEHTGFHKSPEITDRYWNIRKGLLPIVASKREKGANLITEDVVFPIERLAEGVRRLNELFVKHGYPEGMVLGHALEGNMHFILAPKLDSDKEIARFNAFLQAITDMVALEFDGSLKGEHGTGRNIAPFVRKEWGDEIYQIMCDLKKLFDPDLILNPDVIISNNTMLHVTSVKAMPAIDHFIDECMECGFCEPACPSDGLSLTPRQRISAYRNIELLKKEGSDPALVKELTNAYQYKGIETCATTSMCALRCPVGIDTGAFIKAIKANNPYKKTAVFAQNNIALLTTLGRAGMRFNNVVGHKNSEKITTKLHQYFKKIPVIPISMPKAASAFTPEIIEGNQPIVYFVSCVNRIFSDSHKISTSTAKHTLNLFKKAGYNGIIPENMNTLCCGQPFHSMNAEKESTQSLTSLNNALLTASDNGKIPIYIDNAPCALRVLEAKKEHLIDERLIIYDAATFLAKYILPKLTIYQKKSTLALHIPCSTTKTGANSLLEQLAKNCTEELFLSNIDCCGFAGNKGFFTPELNGHALRNIDEIQSKTCDCGVSSSKTCQIGLTTHSGISYQSIEALLDECSDPINPLHLGL